MKKILFVALMLVAGVNISFAQKPEAKIKFDKELHDFGKFTEAEGEQHCVFTFVRRCPTDNQSSSCQLRMYGAIIYKDSNCPR